MAIKYDKLTKIMDERGITSYVCRQKGIIGQASYKKIRDGGNIDMRTLDNLCKYLDCQPGELIEYVPDAPDNTINSDSGANIIDDVSDFLESKIDEFGLGSIIQVDDKQAQEHSQRNNDENGADY